MVKYFAIASDDSGDIKFWNSPVRPPVTVIYKIVHNKKYQTTEFIY